jgi:hypothetical protein
LVEELKSGKHLSGWLEVPTDIVTSANVEEFKPREGDAATQKTFYAKYLAEHFADLAKAARPYDDLKQPPK